MDETQIPAQEPAGVEGAGEAAPAESGMPGEGSVEGTLGAAPEPYDQDAVISSGGESAVKQYKDLQRALSREQQKLQKYKALEPHIDGLGGGQGVFDVLKRFDRLLSNPQMEKMIAQFEQTGSLPTERPAYGESDYEEPEDPVQTEIRALKSEISALRGKFGQQGIRAHLDELKKEFPDVDEWLPPVEQELQSWSRDPSRRELINNVDYETLKLMVLRTLYGDQESRAKRGAKEYSRLLELKKARATDSPQVGATTGTEPSAKQASHFFEALEEFKRKEGITGPIRYDG